MRLDPMHLTVESFPTSPFDGQVGIMGNSQAPCAPSTSPCLDSDATCDAKCLAADDQVTD